MKRPLRVAVIGAGLSGIFAGFKLDAAGLDFTIFEKRARAGGTWDTNTYPGLSVDTLTRSYEFPFARSYHWSRRYAPGSEVRAYFHKLAETPALRRHIRFNTEVSSAVWRDGAWILTLADGETDAFDIVLLATGFLRVPSVPNIEGMDTFKGRSFHSSQWDESIDLTDQTLRFGIVGTGSSGVQITTAMGTLGNETTQFIRHPQWMQVSENPPYTFWERLQMRVPVLSKRYDKRMSARRASMNGNETWRLVPGPDREEMKARFLKMLEDEIPDPELRAKFTPTEPLGVKRIAKTPNYYRVVQQPNVHPVFAGIQRVEPDGVLDSDGNFHPLDVLVWATGFDAHAYMRPMEVIGPEGLSLDDAWKNGVEAYCAIGVPRFPNLFLALGPFAPVNSIPPTAALEDEMSYLLRLFDEIARTERGYAPTREATDRFLRWVSEALPLTTYSEGENWYSQKVGVPIIWPFTKAVHTEQYANLDMNDFDSYPLASQLPQPVAAAHI